MLSAESLMLSFLSRTQDRPERRYLYTDAFAVRNLVRLGRMDLALQLVKAVHQTLGQHREHNRRWLSSCPVRGCCVVGCQGYNGMGRAGGKAGGEPTGSGRPPATPADGDGSVVAFPQRVPRSARLVKSPVATEYAAADGLQQTAPEDPRDGPVPAGCPSASPACCTSAKRASTNCSPRSEWLSLTTRLGQPGPASVGKSVSWSRVGPARTRPSSPRADSQRECSTCRAGSRSGGSAAGSGWSAHPPCPVSGICARAACKLPLANLAGLASVG